jgi:hypothetical protein
MKYLLIGGAENVGKTGAIWRLTDYLLNPSDPLKYKEFIEISLPNLLDPKEFRLNLKRQKSEDIPKNLMAKLSGRDKNGNDICEYFRKKTLNGNVTHKDFMAKLSGRDKNGNDIHIAINSATDNEDLIDNFQQFIDGDNNISIIISSIRDNYVDQKNIRRCCDKPRNLRKCFFCKLGISKDDIVIELLLAEIDEPKKNKKISLKCYEDKIDKMLQKLVKGLLLFRIESD